MVVRRPCLTPAKSGLVSGATTPLTTAAQNGTAVVEGCTDRHEKRRMRHERVIGSCFYDCGPPVSCSGRSNWEAPAIPPFATLIFPKQQTHQRHQVSGLMPRSSIQERIRNSRSEHRVVALPARQEAINRLRGSRTNHCPRADVDTGFRNLVSMLALPGATVRCLAIFTNAKRTGVV